MDFQWSPSAVPVCAYCHCFRQGQCCLWRGKVTVTLHTGRTGGSGGGDGGWRSALSRAQLLPQSGGRQFQYKRNFPRLVILPFFQQFPLVISLREKVGFFPVSVGPSNLRVKHHSSQKEVISIQIVSSFAESSGGKSNTSVTTVLFVKVRHYRLAFLFLTTEAWVNFFVWLYYSVGFGSCPASRFCCFV